MGEAPAAELRLMVATQIISRVLSLSGVDRPVSIYPSMEAATAARPPAALAQATGPAHGNRESITRP